MAWKIEKWLSDVFPGPSHIYEEYRNLTRRELAIVAAGGVLTGTITSDDAETLRVIKNIRNCFAHSVKVDFTSPEVLPLTRKLCERWEERTMRLAIPSISQEAVTAGMSEIRKHLISEPEAGAGLLLSIFSTYQAYFHRLSDRVTPIEDVLRQRTK